MMKRCLSVSVLPSFSNDSSMEYVLFMSVIVPDNVINSHASVTHEPDAAAVPSSSATAKGSEGSSSSCKFASAEDALS